jgi:ACS family glucarate transporter-like MFS transporter
MLMAACIALLGIGVCQVLTWSAVQDLGRTNAGLLTGVVSFGGNLSGGASPLLCAILVEHTGSWMNAFLMLGATGLAGAVFWIAVPAGEPQSTSAMSAAPGQSAELSHFTSKG